MVQRRLKNKIKQNYFDAFPLDSAFAVSLLQPISALGWKEGERQRPRPARDAGPPGEEEVEEEGHTAQGHLSRSWTPSSRVYSFSYTISIREHSRRLTRQRILPQGLSRHIWNCREGIVNFCNYSFLSKKLNPVVSTFFPYLKEKKATTEWIQLYKTAADLKKAII